MQPSLFDILPDRQKTESIKWHAYEPDVLPMWVADMDFRSPQAVIDALCKRVEHGVFGYPYETKELHQVIVDRLDDLYHWQVLPEEIVFLPGVVAGFNLVCHTMPQDGKGVLIQTPVYPPFFPAPGNAGLVRQEMELTRQADGSYGIDFDAFNTAVTETTGLFLMSNPHNPVGRVFHQDELEKMAEICLRNGVTICADEIHCDLLFSGQRHIPMASISPEVAQNTITLMAPSKTFNIAGLECAYAVVQNAELRKRLQAARQGMVVSVNLMGLVGALAAYQGGQAWLDELLIYLEGNRDFLFDTIEKKMPMIRMAKPEATYLAWLDCRQAGIEGSPYQFFLKNARVAMNDGKTFGKGGEGFVRLNFGCPRSMLAEALDRMRTALNHLSDGAG